MSGSASASGDPAPAVYPVQLVVQGRRIWVGWQSCDEPDGALLKGRAGLLWAQTKSALLEQCGCARRPLRVEDETTFDCDAVRAKLIARAAVDGDEVIGCWNLLLDVRASLEPGFHAAFAADPRYLRSYDRFFSSTVAAELIDVGLCEIEGADFDIAAEFISSAMLRLLALTQGRLRHETRGLS